MDTIFKNNPNLDYCYKTSDGKYFYNEDAANNHARNLEDKSVSKLVRPVEKTETPAELNPKVVGEPNPEAETSEKIEEAKEIKLPTPKTKK